MNKPKISVVLAIYNAQDYLSECLRSILDQTFTDFEVLMVNDGSTDNSLEICESFSSVSDRFFVINKENGGYGSAMNLGISHAKGEYLAIIEPDDYIRPTMFEELYNKAKQNNLDIVKSGFASFNEEDRQGSIHKFDWASAYTIPPEGKVFTIYDYPWLLAVHPSTVTCLYRLDFLREHNIKYTEAKGGGWVDNLFQVQTMVLAKSIMYVDKVFYLWRLHSTNSGAGLKDYKIPVERTKEIHDWLYENHYYDDRLLEPLYKRELNYLEQLLAMDFKYIELDFSNYDYKLGIMAARMKENVVLNSEIISNKKKALYLVCKKDPKLARRILEYLE